MADNTERPSFTSFWKKGKAKLKGKEITFVGQGSSSSPKDEQGGQDQPQSQKDKAQARRAQVRKAQIQHRQRKANYVRELELDVTKYRDLISQTERESASLQKENDSMKNSLAAAGIDPSLWAQQARGQTQSPASISSGQQPGSLPSEMGLQQTDPLATQLQAQHLHDYGNYPQQDQSPELFGNIDIDDLTVTLSVDETMGTPCLNISSNSSGVSISSAASPPRSDGDAPLTPAQEQMAINFILALEHVCWNHFSLAGCPEAEDADEKGHTLMASAYCMNTAPSNVFTDSAGLEKSPPPAGTPSSFQWQGPGLTLESLYGLALSLNPGDMEVTPVQAWFELAGRYGAQRLLKPQVLDLLKKEFRGVVRCVFFGATMERSAFESVVGRVLGPAP